jgi:lysophospholipase L1-like esterase
MSDNRVVGRRVTRWLLAFPVASILLLAQASTAAFTTAPPVFTPPKHYYLSLGDSFGFGLQLQKLIDEFNTGTYLPESFNTGYTDVFAELMRRIRPDLTVVNYSCPGGGGDTTRFLTDGCFFTDIGIDLHNNFTGSQMDAAVTFLRSHRGQVGPVTLSTGGDDIAEALYDCNADPDCVAGSGLANRLADELGQILSRLRSAAPDAEIILLLPLNGASINLPGSNDVWGTYVEQMRSIAAAHRVRVVDAFSAITLSGRECELTFLCSTGDEHPTDDGYSVLGHLFFDAADYARLRR